jgi:hypothetical protein
MPTKIFKGWQAKIFIQGLEIGCCKNVTVNYDSPIEPYYEIENPNMVPITSIDQLGLVAISGTITRAWVNTYYLKLLFGGVVPVIPNTEFDLVLQASNEIGDPMLYLYQCRFTKGTINIPASGWLEESYDFIAMSAHTSEVPLPIIHLTSHCINESDEDDGEIVLDGSHSLPSDVSVSIGDYTVEFSIGGDYSFLYWETIGGISVDDSGSNPTTAHVTGNGTLRAVFEYTGC